MGRNNISSYNQNFCSFSFFSVDTGDTVSRFQNLPHRSQRTCRALLFRPFQCTYGECKHRDQMVLGLNVSSGLRCPTPKPAVGVAVDEKSKVLRERYTMRSNFDYHIHFLYNMLTKPAVTWQQHAGRGRPEISAQK